MAKGLLHITALALALALASGCKAKPGGRCSANQTACEDPHTGLFCLDGKFTEMTCGGPDGCVAAGKQVDCDNTIANKGDGCSESEDLACTADKKGELRCRGNHFIVASTCRGPTGCFFTGNKLHCDTDVADSNDPCEEKDDLACSVRQEGPLQVRRPEVRHREHLPRPQGVLDRGEQRELRPPCRRARRSVPFRGQLRLHRRQKGAFGLPWRQVQAGKKVQQAVRVHRPRRQDRVRLSVRN